jgi:hypothetical protein
LIAAAIWKAQCRLAAQATKKLLRRFRDVPRDSSEAQGSGPAPRRRWLAFLEVQRCLTAGVSNAKVLETPVDVLV